MTKTDEPMDKLKTECPAMFSKDGFDYSHHSDSNPATAICFAALRFMEGKK